MKKSNINKTFHDLKGQGRKALITFVVAGDPTPDATTKLIDSLFAGGSDIVEIGMPFSDPSSEGATIRLANERAMDHGITLDHVFDMVSSIRQKHDKPIVLLTYFNMVFRYTPQQFVKKCVEVGVDGVIIPDLPYEEREEVAKFSNDQPLDLITMYSPLSVDRCDLLAEKAEGFLYCISSLGTTGVRRDITTDFTDLMKPLERYPHLPTAIGFGISTPDQARQLKAYADGIIVGSALVELIAQKNSLNESQAAVFEFVSAMREALDAPHHQNDTLQKDTLNKG